MNYSLKHLLLAGISMLAGTLAYAQVTTSSMAGRVADEKGEPVVGAAVVATHEPSGTVYGATVNQNGQYTINGMRSGGPYKIEVSSVGYTSLVFKDVTLQLAETYNLNATLKESTEFLEQVVVIGTAKSRFSTEKTGAATNINSQQIESLPTVSRSITDVTRLSPYGGNGMSFAGSDGRTANFTVDGANFNNNFGLSDKLPGGGSPIPSMLSKSFRSLFLHTMFVRRTSSVVVSTLLPSQVPTHSRDPLTYITRMRTFVVILLMVSRFQVQELRTATLSTVLLSVALSSRTNSSSSLTMSMRRLLL